MDLLLWWNEIINLDEHFLRDEKCFFANRHAWLCWSKWLFILYRCGRNYWLLKGKRLLFSKIKRCLRCFSQFLRNILFDESFIFKSPGQDEQEELLRYLRAAICDILHGVFVLLKRYCWGWGVRLQEIKISLIFEKSSEKT